MKTTFFLGGGRERDCRAVVGIYLLIYTRFIISTSLGLYYNSPQELSSKEYIPSKHGLFVWGDKGEIKWNVTPLIRRGSNFHFFAAYCGFLLDLSAVCVSVLFFYCLLALATYDHSDTRLVRYTNPHCIVLNFYLISEGV